MSTDHEPLRGRILDTLAHVRNLTADAATGLTRRDQAHDLYEAAHCTDPAPHAPHEYADDTDLRHCTGTPTTATTHTHFDLASAEPSTIPDEIASEAMGSALSGYDLAAEDQADEIAFDMDVDDQ